MRVNSIKRAQTFLPALVRWCMGILLNQPSIILSSVNHIFNKDLFSLDLIDEHIPFAKHHFAVPFCCENARTQDWILYSNGTLSWISRKIQLGLSWLRGPAALCLYVGSAKQVLLIYTPGLYLISPSTRENLLKNSSQIRKLISVMVACGI